MLENDLEKLFRLEASADQPPSQISVPAAGRDPRPWHRGGRALSTRQTRRTRLIVAIGSPVLAAAAVAAILASGTLLSTTTTCWLGSGELNCTPSIFGGPPLVVTGTAPDIAGHRAYWVTYSGETYLAWRYSARGWALLESPSAVKIAQHITFGSSAASASLRFAAQLTGLPKGWQVSSDRFVPQDGVPLAVQFQFTKGPQADEPGAGDRGLNSLVISAMPPAQGLPCDLGNHVRVIDGYKVTTGTSRGDSHLPQEADLCAPSADGLYIFVQAYGLHPVMGAVTAFRHLRLLGANPANWTTSPVG